MKLILSVVMIILLLVVLVGCVDFVQMISIKNGILHTSIKFTLQKSLFEMISSFSGEEINYDEFIGIGENSFEQLSFAGVDGIIKKHENLFDIGAEITIQGSYKTLNELLDDQYDFIPIKHNDRYILTIPSMADTYEDSDGFTSIFLSGVKYRIIISLADDLKDISRADVYFDQGFGELYPLSNDEGCTVSINGSLMLIEIPMMLLFVGDGSLFIEFYHEKG